MDVWRQAAGHRDLLHDAGDAARGQWPAAAVDEQFLRVPFSFLKYLAAHRAIRRQRFRSRAFQRHVTLFLPFAADQDYSVGFFNITQLDSYQFRVAQAAAVKQLENGAVAFGKGGAVRYL